MGEEAKQAWLDTLERALLDDNMRKAQRLVGRLRSAGAMFVDPADRRLKVRNKQLTRIDWADINAVRPAFCAVIILANARARRPRGDPRKKP